MAIYRIAANDKIKVAIDQFLRDLIQECAVEDVVVDSNFGITPPTKRIVARFCNEVLSNRLTIDELSSVSGLSLEYHVGQMIREKWTGTVIAISPAQPMR